MITGLIVHRHFFGQNMIDEYRHSDGDGAVCNVECRPMHVPNVHIQKIHHCAEPNPVDHVADSTAKYQGKGGCQHFVGIGCVFVKIQNKGKREKRDKNKNKTPDFRTLVGKKAECASGIQDVGKIEKTGNDRNRMVQVQILLDDVF